MGYPDKTLYLTDLPTLSIKPSGLFDYWDMLETLLGLTSFRGPPPLSVDQSLAGIIRE